MNNYSKVIVSSAFDPDQPQPDYILILEAAHNTNNGQVKKVEQKFPITQFYDKYGYLHRYVVRDAVEVALAALVRA